MISIIISSRELERKNLGNLDYLLSSLKTSLYDFKNVEVIFKFDEDDFLIEDKLTQAATNNPEINIKYFFSKRHGYLGLHKAYYEALEIIDPSSYIIVITADDFLFRSNSNWDKHLLENSSYLKNEPFIVQDTSRIGQMHDTPIFSKKLIDLVTLGNSLSVDGLLVDLCKFYLESNLNEYIVSLPEIADRRTCSYDWGHKRWNIEREELIEYLNSEEYKKFLNDKKEIIKQYFKL
jgi:hypothetical protein